MRIAITVDPELPVPPVYYGGIERIVALLIDGLNRLGCQVSLFANPDSGVACELIPFEGASSSSWRDTLRNAAQIRRAASKGSFDVIHSFGRMAYLLPVMRSTIPKLMSYQRPISARSVGWGKRLSGRTLQFSACSRAMIREVEHLCRWHVVYNAVNMDQYKFRAQVEPDAPLVFLGRIEWIKGPHLAVEAAQASGRRLIIAGNVPDEHREYFESQIRPHLDGQQIRYAGPVNDREKDEILGGAAALLMPILWEEPFGIVMAEALACGTPVIGLRRGAVPEVVSDGVNGFVCHGIEETISAIRRIADIDRHACRRIAEERFSSHVMVAEYLRIYETMVAPLRRAA